MMTGFRQALIGCYIGMADVDLYGKQLTWYSTEMQSGQYTIHSQAYVYAMGTTSTRPSGIEYA
ncbi:MAG: hypothetical protein ACLU4N_02880 [Butyricimonas faecihominis]